MCINYTYIFWYEIQDIKSDLGTYILVYFSIYFLFNLELEQYRTIFRFNYLMNGTHLKYSKIIQINLKIIKLTLFATRLMEHFA